MDGQAYRQNQDLRDYRILGILPARAFASQALDRIPLGEISGYGKSASRAKRNPENPANPDSDKAAPPFPYFRAAVPAFYPAIPAFLAVIPAKAGIQRVGAKPAARNQAPRPAGGSHLTFRSVIPALPRHSRESGNPDDCSQAHCPKPSLNSSRRIPSPFMGLQG